MQEPTTALFCTLVIASLAYVMVQGHAHSSSSEVEVLQPMVSGSVMPALTTPPPTQDAGAGPVTDAGAATAAPLDEEADALQRVLRGGPVPKLPNTAPRSVDIGVILLTHREAQFAPQKSRSKRDAYARALELLEEARGDFREAAKKGDPGSTEDAGTVPRGVLEPALEYVVYTMEKGEVFPKPLDTPRGFWIVRRTR